MSESQGPGGQEQPEQPELSGGRPEARRMIAQLADELMPVLIARLEASALGELEVRENGWRVRLRRPVSQNGVAPSDEPLLPARTFDGGGTESGPARERSEWSERAERSEKRSQLTSPAVGYFVPREGLTVGAGLRNGDVIGHIDVLGVKQEVVVPFDAMLARLEVEAGQAVEYGELIARLEPEGRG